MRFLALFIVAQTSLLPPEDVDPLGGWGSLFLQGGAFALLTYIVVWLGPRIMQMSVDERRERDLAAAKEREADRVARHNIADRFTQAVAECWEMSSREAGKDRAAFAVRSEKMEARLTSLEKKLDTVCRFDQPPTRRDGCDRE